MFSISICNKYSVNTNWPQAPYDIEGVFLDQDHISPPFCIKLGKPEVRKTEVANTKVWKGKYTHFSISLAFLCNFSLSRKSMYKFLL